MCPNRAKNLDLNDSLVWARQNKARVYLFGPYEIDKKLYDLALKQIAFLEKGTVRYRMLDEHLRPDKAVNCIHAISDMVPDKPLEYTAYVFGEKASALVVKHLKPWVHQPEPPADWLLEKLELIADGVVREK